MNRKIIALAVVLFALAGTAFAQTTATKFFVAHQGGYIGEATVTIDAAGKVTAASIAEWQGPGGWAENNSPDGKAIVDGAVVRVPDPMANQANADPAIKGFMFYIYNQVEKGPGVWSQFTPGKDGFTRPTRQYERDFEGLMSNPVRAAAYAAAAKADTLVNVKIDGLKVTVGKKASQTVHYGHMDKANKASVYMPLNETSIGYRYNNLATLNFFKANPTANFAAATVKKTKVTLKEDKNIDPAGIAAYTAADDGVYAVADAVSGATYSDFMHYSLELQAAYKIALAEGRVKFTK
jgi:hypothetical protein